MSQWSNRFAVLDNLNGEIQPITSLKLNQEQSQNMFQSPSPSSTSIHSKIHIRSARHSLSTSLSIQLQTLDTRATVSVSALLDSGATGLFLDSRFAQEINLNTNKLSRAIPVYNVDETLN